jgi:hypothetical protein
MAMDIKHKIEKDEQRPKKKSFHKRWLVAFLVSLLVFAVTEVISRLLVTSTSTPSNVVSEILVLLFIFSGLSLFVCLQVWLILVLKWKVLILYFALIVIAVIAYFVYEGNLSTKRRVACETIHQKAEEFQTNYGNLVQLLTKEQADTNSAKVYSEPLYNKIISDYKNLQKTNDDTYNSLKENIDVNKKYMSLFTDWDMSKSSESAQEVHDVLNQAFIAEINYVQAVIDNKPDSELNALRKTADNKWIVTFDISGLEALTTVNNLALVRCNLLFSTPLFNNNLQQQNIFVPYYKKQ